MCYVLLRSYKTPVLAIFFISLFAYTTPKHVKIIKIIKISSSDKCKGSFKLIKEFVHCAHYRSRQYRVNMVDRHLHDMNNARSKWFTSLLLAIYICTTIFFMITKRTWKYLVLQPMVFLCLYNKKKHLKRMTRICIIKCYAYLSIINVW